MPGMRSQVSTGVADSAPQVTAAHPVAGLAAPSPGHRRLEAGDGLEAPAPGRVDRWVGELDLLRRREDAWHGVGLVRRVLGTHAPVDHRAGVEAAVAAAAGAKVVKVVVQVCSWLLKFASSATCSR